MTARVLLDTHILIRWLADPNRLSRDQARVLNEVIRRSETVAISDITLLEIAILHSGGALRMKLSIDEVFNELESSPVFRILPLTIEIAKEVASLGEALRDPADRVIVATARVHGLRLLTSDQRFMESNVVSVVG